MKIYVISSRERLLLPLAFCFCLLLENTLLWSGPTAGLTAAVCDWYGLHYPEGRGVYTFAEGGTLEGYWEKGCKNGVFEYTAPDGTKAKRCYRDDKESSFS